MKRILVTPQAELDLTDIWVYIAYDNSDAADRWLLTIQRRFESLRDAPEVGVERNELVPGLRSIPVGNYLIFYRPISDGIEVIRVLHGARDIDSIFLH